MHNHTHDHSHSHGHDLVHPASALLMSMPARAGVAAALIVCLWALILWAIN